MLTHKFTTRPVVQLPCLRGSLRLRLLRGGLPLKQTFNGLEAAAERQVHRPSRGEVLGHLFRLPGRLVAERLS